MTPSRAHIAKSILLVLTTFIAARAAATPAEIFGATPDGIALSNTLTATSEDGAAAYYNPAGLAVGGSSGHPSVQFSYVGGKPFFYIDRYNKDPAVLKNYPTHDPQGQGYISFAGLLPIGGKINNRASLGILFSVPQNNFLHVISLEPAEPQWLRYQSDVNRINVVAGIGVRPIDMLAFGIGVQTLAIFQGQVSFNADLGTSQINHRNVNINLKPATALTAGITFIPRPDMKFSLAYRGALDLEISQPDAVSLGTLGALNIAATGSVLYSPDQLAFGWQYAPIENLSLALDVRFERWFVAPNPAFHIAVNGTGDVLSSLGLDVATTDPAVRFRNTVTPGVAAVYKLSPNMQLRGSYAFRPTYIQDLSRSSANFLDGNTHLIGLGATLQFHDPIDWLANTIKLDLGLQAQLMPRQEVLKPGLETEAQTDPVGSLAFGGAAIAAAGGLRYDF